MVSLDQLILFFTLTFLLSASPGPVMLSCMTNGGHYGLHKAAYGMAGACIGNLILMMLSALGLGLLLTEAEYLFNVIKWAGAAYLIFLGLQLFFKKTLVGNVHADHYGRSKKALFFQSIAIAVGNPKALVYFGALFPQFISPDHSLVMQFSILTLVFLSLDLVWMIIYAKAGSYILSWLKSPGHYRLFNRISGGAMMTMGVLLAFSNP